VFPAWLVGQQELRKSVLVVGEKARLDDFDRAGDGDYRLTDAENEVRERGSQSDVSESRCEHYPSKKARAVFLEVKSG
jgi:hypothetical protein